MRRCRYNHVTKVLQIYKWCGMRQAYTHTKSQGELWPFRSRVQPTHQYTCTHFFHAASKHFLITKYLRISWLYLYKCIDRRTAHFPNFFDFVTFSVPVRVYILYKWVDSPGRNRSLKEVVMGSSATSHPGWVSQNCRRLRLMDERRDRTQHTGLRWARRHR